MTKTLSVNNRVTQDHLHTSEPERTQRTAADLMGDDAHAKAMNVETPEVQASREKREWWAKQAAQSPSVQASKVQGNDAAALSMEPPSITALIQAQKKD